MAYDQNAYFAAVAQSESGNNPNAVNPNGGAFGLYQFMPNTWRGLMQNHPELGLTWEGRFDLEQQNRAMEAFTGESASALERAGLPVTGENLRILHFFGPSYGIRAIQAPQGTPLTQIIPQSWFGPNPILNGWTTSDLTSWAGRTSGGGGTSPTAYAPTTPTVGAATPAAGAAAGQAGTTGQPVSAAPAPSTPRTFLERLRERIRQNDPSRETRFLDNLIRLRQEGQQRVNDISLPARQEFLGPMQTHLQEGGQNTPILNNLMAGTPFPILSGIRERRQAAGHETPFLNTVLGIPQPTVAPAASPPYTPTVAPVAPAPPPAAGLPTPAFGTGTIAPIMPPAPISTPVLPRVSPAAAVTPMMKNPTIPTRVETIIGNLPAYPDPLAYTPPQQTGGPLPYPKYRKPQAAVATFRR